MATTEWEQQAGMTGTVDTDNVQDLVEQAEDAESNASTSETNAAASATAAAASATASAASATTSTASAGTATTKASEASTSAANAYTSEVNAAASESAASTSETNAATYASSASTSATSASTSATNAATSETNAATSETNAATSETNAATSATNAATSATNASASETAAAASETAAAASESAAATSETNAATSATTATTQATNAATSATNAATSETNAASSASSASTSATSASTSATNAATSATAAAASQTAAAASAASAASAYDSFDDRYLGTKSADPTLDNDGNALVSGALYFNSTANEMRVYDGGNWIAASSAGGASLYYYNYTATSSQTTFSGADDNANTLSYTVDNLIVTLNGVTLENGTDYTATDGTSVVLTSAAATSDELNIVAFKSFTTADMVSATNGGTFQGAVTFNAGANFGDNDKAIFGAGSDLQIYHDGTYNHSNIKELGSGDLQIWADNLTFLKADGSETKAKFISDGACELYHDGNYKKLATTSTGIDVTGTVTADGLTVGDGTTTTVSAIDTGNSYGLLMLKKAGVEEWRVGLNGNDNITFRNTDSKNYLTLADNGDISFYEDTGTTAKFFWDASAESLGIGTSSPDAPFTIQRPSNNQGIAAGLSLKGQDGTTQGGLGTDGVNDNAVQLVAAQFIKFHTNNTDGTANERMRIDSSGNVGIGTSSPSATLDVTTTIRSNANAATNDATVGKYSFYNTNASASSNPERAYIEAGRENSAWGAYLKFGTSTGTNAATERMRIDSSGNLLVGKTSSSESSVGVELRPYQAIITRNNAAPLKLRRNTTDGDIVEFAKDGSTVGSIGTLSGYFHFVGATNGIRSVASRIQPCTSTGGNADNIMDLGYSTVRWDDIYATNGTIQTSDEREKQDIDVLSDAEQRVAVAAKGLIRKFRWKDAVAEKGDDARIHFGVIAQDLKAAFEAEGLDAGRYAMFIHSEWWETYTDVPAVEAKDAVLDDDGNVIEEAVEAVDAYTRTDTYDTEAEAPEGAVKKDRMGVRYPELLAFIIGAL